MGNKRNSNVTQLHQPNSFQKTVAEAVNAKVAQHIQEQMNYMGGILARELQNSLEDIYSRLSALEKLALGKFGVTENEFALLVAEMQDSVAGLVSVNSVEPGDLVRLEISTKTVEQAEYQGSSRQRLPNAGSGETFGPQIEQAIVNMTLNEIKEIKFGKDDQMVAKINVQRISRAPKKEEVVTSGLAQTEEEGSNENQNAG